MRNFLKPRLFIFVILILTAFLRFYNLAVVPPGVHTDEADTGYSAYSLLRTGLDPHGQFNFLALSDDNIGGTHPPLYTYILMPLVQFFGLNIFVERLPSAVFGTLTILLVYFISKKLFSSDSVATVASFLMAVNPWAIHISRQGLLEAQSLFFVLLGVVLFLYMEKNKYFLILSALAFGFSFYSYQAPRIFLPLFLVMLFFYQKKQIYKMKKLFFVFVLIIFVFYMSILKLTFLDRDNDYNNRFLRSSILTSVKEAVDNERTLTKAPLSLSSIFHNKLSTTIKRVETSYFSIFSLNWFFLNGDGNLQHSVGNHGEFYLFELPFFFMGLSLIFIKSRKTGILLLSWMLLGAFPGGLTTGNYVYRSVHVLPVPILFSSLAIVWFWQRLNKLDDYKKTIVRLGAIAVASIYISSYLFTYFFDYPVYASESWAKQQNDAIKFAISQKSSYQTVFVDGGEPWAVNYAYFSKLDPVLYHKAYKNQQLYNNIKVMKIDNFIFGSFPLESVATPSAFFPEASLVITNALNFPKAETASVFYDPGGVRAIFKAVIVR